jgi:hypothetical protein
MPPPHRRMVLYRERVHVDGLDLMLKVMPRLQVPHRSLQWSTLLQELRILGVCLLETLLLTQFVSSPIFLSFAPPPSSLLSSSEEVRLSQPANTPHEAPRK